jgi:class 3 adenylate cyclase
MASRRQVASRELRASDVDRDQAVERLREHFGAGRLTEEEFDARVDRAYASATHGDLDALTFDLPDEPRRALAPAPKRHVTKQGRALRASFRHHFWVYALVNLMLIGIWAASGGGYFWPIWPMLGWGIGVACHGAPILAGAGTRPYEPQRAISAPSSPDEIAAAVNSERPDFGRATAPDGTVTILFSDIANSTEINSRLGDLRWLELLRLHHEIVRDQVTAHRGYEVKAQGDGFMVAFPSARAAVHCAKAIQLEMSTKLGDHPDGPVEVRIGLHTGEAIKEEGDFYGRNVTLAARVAGQAEPGQILASSVVKHLTESAGDVSFGEPVTVELKGLGTETLYPVA